MAAGSQTLKRTPLHDRHVAAGARLVPFAGWEMPVHYPSGIRAEHHAVRERAGVFDVRVPARLHDYAMLAVQGPRARAIVAELAGGELPPRFKTARLTVAGVP